MVRAVFGRAVEVMAQIHAELVEDFIDWKMERLERVLDPRSTKPRLPERSKQPEP